MRNADLPKRQSRIVTLFLLSVLLLSGGWVQAQTNVKEPLLSARPELQAALVNLQRELDAKGATFKVGYNPAMERSLSELTGLVEPPDWRDTAVFEEVQPFLTTYITEGFDWRQEPGGATAVRDQGSCGACWAFATVGPLEILTSLRCGKTEDLSEQYLVSCNNYNYSCYGGWFLHEYHINEFSVAKGETEPGAVLESIFPYKALNVACNGPHPHRYLANSWAYIDSDNAVAPTASIKEAMYVYGPIATAICAGGNFQAYTGDIFNIGDTCTNQVNHAVTLVGWVDDNGTDNGYWIVKNSWGPLWGESGYMRIRYGVSNVGYAANFVHFTECPADPQLPNLSCTAPVTLSLGKGYNGKTLATDPTDVSSYSCTSRNESGPHKVHKITTTKMGDLTATLTNITGRDLDVLILKSCDRNDCVAFGDTVAVYPNAPAGTYYIVVEGNEGALGSYTLKPTLVPAAADLTASWESLTSSNAGKTVSGRVKVSNIGSNAAGAFAVGYYYSTDGVKLGTRLLVQKVTSLAAGQDLYQDMTINYSSSLIGKYIIVKADYAGKVAEKNETNNVAAFKVQ